jgi:molybdopterin molybdotransferase
VLDGGGRLHVCGVAIKPGKPVSFGAIGSSLVMALPGNSTAAYVTFLILGLPLLRHLAGSAMPPTAWQGIRAGFLHRKKSGVREYLRVRLTPQSDGTMRADRCGADGSAMMASLAAADGLVVLADANTEIHEGDLVPFASFAALKVA